MSDAPSTDPDSTNQAMTGAPLVGSGGELEPVMVTLTFQTDRADDLLAVLAKYVVLSRMDPASRNIDLVASVTKPGRLTIIEKWASSTAQQAHFDSATMIDMATACVGLLSAPPDIDLHEAVTMHDLD